MKNGSKALAFLLVCLMVLSTGIVVFAADEIKTTTVKTVSIADTFKDAEKWDAMEGTVEFKDGKLQYVKAGEALFGYQGAEYTDELLQFKAKFSFEGGSVWQGVAIRAAATRTVAWSGNPSYLVVVKQDQIELQRFSAKGVQTFLAIIPNDGVIEDQKEYNISIGAVNLNDGVNIMLFVDDACIFNYFDNSEDAIKTGGYMNIYGGNEIILSEYDNKNSLTDLPAAVTISGEAKEGETLSASYELLSFGGEKAEDLKMVWTESTTYNGELTEFDEKQMTDFREKYDPVGTYAEMKDVTDSYQVKEEDKNKYFQVQVADKDGKVLAKSPVAHFDTTKIIMDQSVILYVDCEYAYVKGEKLQIDPDDYDVMPTIVGDRTLVPLRFIAESFGADVKWDEATEGITISLDGKTIKMTLGKKEYTVDGKEFLLDEPAQTMYDRTMVPIRAISEAFDKVVFWDPEGLIVISDEDLELDSEADAAVIDSIIDDIVKRI